MRGIQRIYSTYYKTVKAASILRWSHRRSFANERSTFLLNMITDIMLLCRVTTKTFRQCCRKPTVLVPLCLITALGLFFNTRMMSLVYNPPYHDIETNTIRHPEAYVCKPRSNIVFIKTHKCASSSLQNIFMRYGDYHNLTFVLPASGNYLGHPAPFNRSMVPDAKKFNLSYNILTHHCRFNYNEMKLLMPNDTVFVTIVRDPVELYESLYSYYWLSSVYKKSLEDLMKNYNPKLFKKRIHNRLGSNQMLFDLGYDVKSTNESHILSYVKTLDSMFDLVMVAEKMEESLVLLRHLLCWQIDDMVVFKVNARDNKLKKNLTGVVRKNVQKLNSADQILYDYFVAQFDQRVKEFGASAMAEEVQQLRNRTAEFYDICVKKPSTKSKIITFEVKQGTNETCRALTFSELAYTNYLRKKQQFMYPAVKTKPPKAIRPKRARSRVFIGKQRSIRGVVR